MLYKVKVFNSSISTGSFDEFVESIFLLAEQKNSSYICFANVHMLMEAQQNTAFQRILDKADIVSPDGNPVAFLVKYLYKFRQERIAGMDILPRLLYEANRRKKKVFFLGSTQEVLNKIERRIENELPQLKVAGTYSPPFRKLKHKEEQQMLYKINSCKPDLLFVALGCPKQEFWMAQYKSKINACMLGVGQAFLVYAGMEKRLPQWARNYSLEWLYRLYQEPGRLWKRYLITNSLFIWYFIRAAINFKEAHRNKDSIE